jgi:hypothetical protein
MHVVDPGAHRAQELPAHIAEDIVLIIEALGIHKHHFREAQRVIGKVPVQPQALLSPAMEPSDPLKKPCPFLAARLVGLVEEALAEIDAAQHILVRDRHLIELDVRLGVLDIGLHQRRALLNILDQHLFAANGLLHQCCLLRRELMHLRILWLLLFAYAQDTQRVMSRKVRDVFRNVMSSS